MLRCSLKFNPQSVIRYQQFALWVKMSNRICVMSSICISQSNIKLDHFRPTWRPLSDRSSVRQQLLRTTSLIKPQDGIYTLIVFDKADKISIQCRIQIAMAVKRKNFLPFVKNNWSKYAAKGPLLDNTWITNKTKKRETLLF